VNFISIIGFTAGGVAAVAAVARLLLEFALAD